MAAVLVLLNTYPLLVSQDLVFYSKEVSLQSSVSVNWGTPSQAGTG